MEESPKVLEASITHNPDVLMAVIELDRVSAMEPAAHKGCEPWNLEHFY